MKKLLCLLCAVLSLTTYAESTFIERKDVRAFIDDTHKQYGLSKEDIEQALSKVQLQKRVIHSIKNPKEAQSWTNYRRIFITDDRIEKGLAFMKKHQVLLEKAEHTFGVPKEIIIAIIGVETHFGTKQGKYRVLDSLATLAFDFKKRAPFFKKELAHFLTLCHEQNIAPESVYGSYAGAIGQPQFMPSSYRAYAIDFDNDGKKDLRNNTADAIGSVANYLKIHGWQKDEGITEKAELSGSNYKKLISSARYAKHSIKKLNRYGIQGNAQAQAKKGSLLALESPQDIEYWLAYPNFFVITKYNTSKQYALAVFLLAERIKQAHAKAA